MTLQEDGSYHPISQYSMTYTLARINRLHGREEVGGTQTKQYFVLYPLKHFKFCTAAI